ncbi:MAG: TetR family transcriptional regulator [Acidimicrobiales bacterium]|jgi:AcrR family transcriptional regulator
MAPTASAPARARTAAHSSDRHGRTTKQRILTAAEQVVLRDGVGHLTLDAAAAEAGLSKGGILYHYPTRDSLVAAMVDRIIDQFEHDIDRHLPEAGSPEAGLPGAYARAYVRATVEPAAAGEERLGAALLAAAAAEPALLVPLQRAAEGWQARMVEDGLDPALATVIRMACDGLWMCDLFGLASPKGALRASVGAAFDEMTRAVP